MEQKVAISYDKQLLDNLDMSINIILPNYSNNHQLKFSDKLENSRVGNSHIIKIEDYINKKFDQVALEHLKSQIIKKKSSTSFLIPTKKLKQ